MQRTALTKALALVAGLLCSTALTPAKAGDVQKYSPVTQQRLENPEPGNWLLYRRTYDGHLFSPLNQINNTNVKDLVPVWTFSTGVNEGHESPPMVNNGVMFITTPQAQVIALDAKSGELIWRYKHPLPEELFQLHPTNRGVAFWQDRLFLATTDCMLIALDAKTGKELWVKKVQDFRKGQYMTLEPLVVDGKVMVGGSGGEFGIRGYVAAFDANDGKELWRTFTIPAPGEPGSDTWQGDDWKNGGGSVWLTGNYDPKRKIAYWGVGNAAPWPGDAHPGDNLYTSSVIALDPDTGKIVGYHQYHYNDSWDWDEVDPPLLVQLQHNGRSINSLVHPGRDGILWVLEQKDNGIEFVSGQPYVLHTIITSIDEKTGRPTYDPKRKPSLKEGAAEFCPSLWGGKDWPSPSYSDSTKMLYVPAINNMCGTFAVKKTPYEPGQLYTDADLSKLGLVVRGDHLGELQAWDLSTGKQAWVHKFPAQLFASVLSTAGNLVFVGGTNDRYLRAFDAKTGDLLWQQRTNSGITGMPVSYEVDGTQYIAVQSGWGVDAQRIQDSLTKAGLKGINPDVPQGGVVWVFALRRSEAQR
ncbi:MAG: methanol/ethanol family PQQ-dependent dehydrogenase [Acetobacteraceae bacterium]|nr:methanol/ethanol family PQQ-dependent dehydrogenase [Acetobacteraceae bacterium]